MKNSGLNVILLPLLTGLAVYLSFSGSVTQPQSPVTQTPAPSPSATPRGKVGDTPEQKGADPQCHSAEYLLRGFFGLKLPEKKSECAAASQEQSDLRAALAQWQVDFLIATLPDPRATRLNYLFDRHLDAIQRAIEAADYVYDRNWLPWLEEKRTEGVEAGGDHRLTPGVLLFRGRGESQRLLLLFLVGETPTAGIHKRPFHDAIVQLDSLDATAGPIHTAGGQPLLKEIRIMGPTFSGSADSLALSVREWLTHFPAASFRIISGSATAFPQKRFRELIGIEAEDQRVSFAATVIEDKLAQQIFFEYLQESADKQIFPFFVFDDCRLNQNNRPCIAVLSETNTAYGKSFRPSAAAGAEQGNRNGATPPGPAILQLTFPFHISELRAAAEKLRAARPKNAAELPFGEKDNLPLQLGESGEPRDKDVIPPFSQDEVASAQLILEGLLDQIKRERIRYVGIAATDVRDRIFLTREIVSHCPNAVVFTFSNDVYYLHTMTNLDFRGALVITPYPLFNLNQFWTYPFQGDKTLISFPTHVAQGCYNATLALLGHTNQMLEYGEPFTEPSQACRYPAVWLSVVGRNGFWPVRLWTQKELSGDGQPQPSLPGDKWKQLTGYAFNAASNAQAECPKPSESKPASRLVNFNTGAHAPSSLLALLALSLFCLIPAGVLITQLLRHGVKKRLAKTGQRGQEPSPYLLWLDQAPLLARINRTRLAQLFGDEGEELYKFRFRRRAYLYAAVVSLLMFSLPIGLLALLPRFIEPAGTALPVAWWAWPFAIGILSVSSVAFVFIGLSVGHWAVQPGVVPESRREGITIMIVGLLAFLFAILLTLQLGTSPAEKLFFYLRASDVASGVSPLLPLLFTGLAAFASFLCGLRLTNLAERMDCLPKLSARMPPEEFNPFLNFEQPETPSAEGLEAREYLVKRLLICGSFSLPWWKRMMIGVLAYYLYIFFFRFIPTVEGVYFDIFIKLVFFFVPLAIALAFLRFFSLWRALRNLLRRLAWHPLFSPMTLPAAVEKDALPKFDLMTQSPSYTVISFSITQAKRFWELVKDVDLPTLTEIKEELRVQLDNAQAALTQAIQAETQGDWQTALKQSRLAQAATSALSQLVARTLEPYWYAPVKDGNKGWIEQGRFFLVSHVVTFLQHIFAHLQNLIGLVTVGFLLMLLAANSYPFQPREPLLFFTWITVLLVVAATLWVFIEMNRDGVLSLLAGTTPGQLNLSRDLVIRILLHGVVPIVAILGAQFPEMLRGLISWLTAFDGGGH